MPLILNPLNDNLRKIIQKYSIQTQLSLMSFKTASMVLVTGVVTALVYLFLVNKLYSNITTLQGGQLAILRHYDKGRILCARIVDKETRKSDYKNDHSDSAFHCYFI